MAQANESPQKKLADADNEALEAARVEDGDGRTNKMEETHHENEEKMKGEDVGSPSRDAGRRSSFKERDEAAKPEDGDGRTKKMEEAHHENEEKMKEEAVDSPSRDAGRRSSFKGRDEAAKAENRDGRTNKVEEAQHDNVEKMKEIEVDSPSQDAERISSFKERDEEGAAEDGDGRTNKMEEAHHDNEDQMKEKEVDSPSRDAKRSSSFKERDCLRDLKANEKKRLSELKEKVEELFEINEVAEGDARTENNEEPNRIEVASRSLVVEKSSSFNEDGRFKEESNLLSYLKDNEKKALIELRAKFEDAILQNRIFDEEQENCQHKEGEEGALEENGEMGENEKATEKTQRDVTLWGVPLLPSKGGESANVVLLKFLQAREFNVNDTLQMLKKTLRWRKEHGIDSILDEDLGSDFSKVSYMEGMDREGHPVCYNNYGIFEDEELYQKTFVLEDNCRRLFRWRLQMMEREIKKLNFEPGGVSSFLQINDLNNSPNPSRKELRQAMKQAVALLQDDYPEFVSTNIFINVPFWYYALYAVISPFLTQRTKSKFISARPAKVTETLLRYIAPEDIPICYGGLKRENNDEFSAGSSEISELIVKAGSTETVELPTPQIGTTLLWDLTVLGWDVHYKEEFVPTDEKSYTLIVRKGKKMSSTEEPIRNSFINKEPGSVILTIENPTSKRKRVLYRHKTIKSTSSSEVVAD